MTAPASEGIYYVILTPKGWELITEPFARGT